MKDVQATGKVFNPQKRTSALQNNTVHFLTLCVSLTQMRIRIQPNKINAELGPQHCAS